MKTIYIDTLKIHDIQDATCKYFVQQPIDGLSFPALRVSKYDKSGADGIYIPNLFLGERRISIRGKVYNQTSEVTFITDRQTFLAMMKPVKDSGGLPTQRVLRFSAEDGNEYRILCQIIKAEMPIDNIRSADFYIDLLAINNYIESYTATTETVNLYTGGGCVLPVILPAVFETGSGSYKTITNNGDATAYPTIRIYGPITNPRIENLTLGYSLELTLTLATGEYIDIDCANRTILQGGITNKLQYMNSDSIFWWLASGANSIKLTSSVSGETGYAEVTYRHSYMGV